MTNIVLSHNSYDADHLEQVKKEMVKLGSPSVRCFEFNGVWFAIEGCHRLRAAHQLGLTPIIKDISEQKTLTYQVDGDTVKVRLNDEFYGDWYDSCYRNTQLGFNEEDED